MTESQNKYKNKIEITARAVIIFKNKFLLCKERSRDYLFFPGGHIDFGETVEETLRREIKEETDLDIGRFSFIGVLENVYEEDKEKHHEIILAFVAKVNKLIIKERENHLRFLLKTKKELTKEKVLPVAMVRGVLNWLKTKRPFFDIEILEGRN